MGKEKSKLAARTQKIPFWTEKRGSQSDAIEEEKIEIQSRNGSAEARAARNRAAAPRTRNRGKALEETQAQKELEGFADRGIERRKNFGGARLNATISPAP
jgi:hypothetical protein